MNDEELQGLLRSLPRAQASERFTEEVMSRLDGARRPLIAQYRYALAAGLLLMVAAWFGAGRWQDARQREQTRQRIQALRTELEQLQSDVMLLRDLAPVLYLGGDENVDLVIDMRHLVSEAETGSAQPASFDDNSGLAKGETPR